MQLMAKPRGLARTEIAPQYRQSHAAIGARFHIIRGHGSADKTRVERINGSATHPFCSNPDFRKIAHNRLLSRAC